MCNVFAVMDEQLTACKTFNFQFAHMHIKACLKYQPAFVQHYSMLEPPSNPLRGGSSIYNGNSVDAVYHCLPTQKSNSAMSELKFNQQACFTCKHMYASHAST